MTERISVRRAMKTDYRFLLFDVDDTLLDFEKAESAAFSDTMRESGIEITPALYAKYSEINAGLWQELQKGTITQDFLVTERFRRTFELFGIERSAKEVNARYLYNIGTHAILFEDTYPVCEKLSKKYELYMITNSVASVHRSRIKSCPITPFFKDMFISGEVGEVKPSRGFFDKVAQGIKGFEKEKALVIGDSATSDLIGAIDYGIDCVYVNRRGKALPEDLAVNYKTDDLYGLYGILT